MVKAMDFETEVDCVHVRFLERAIFLFFLFLMMMMVERRAAAQASAKRERRRAGMSAANVGASRLLIIKHILVSSLWLYLSLSPETTRNDP